MPHPSSPRPRFRTIVGLTHVFLLLAGSAAAACIDDDDCNGARVCALGSCVEPGAVPSARTIDRPDAVSEPSLRWISRTRIELDGREVGWGRGERLLRQHARARAILEGERPARALAWTATGIGAAMAIAGIAASASTSCDYIGYGGPGGGSLNCYRNTHIGVPLAVGGIAVGVGVGLPLHLLTRSARQRAFRAWQGDR